MTLPGFLWRAASVRRVCGFAVLACAVVTPLPALAQYFSSSGANTSYPLDLFPIDPSSPVLDFGSNTLSVGNGASGSFSVLAGGLLKLGGLNIGDLGTGSGSMTVTGAGSRVDIAAPGSLQVANWGTGSMTISAGAVVDATLNPAGCGTSGCYSFVGNGAGSTGTLTITGAGSELRTLRYMGIGQAAVFTTAVDGFDFGTPGGTTNAFVNVLNGGTLRSEQVVIGRGPNTAAATGTEQAFGTVVVDGPGSRWIATRNSIDNTSAAVIVGEGVGGHASVTIQGGGSLLIDGTGGSATNFDGLLVGRGGGQGTLTVTGVGSTIQMQGNNPYVHVGEGAGSQGSLSVLAGASLSSMFFTVGRDSGNGTLVVDGAGSLLTLSGVGTPGVAGTAFLSVGQTGGTGHVTVSNGAHVVITDGGGDSRPSASSPGFLLGRDAGSTGSMTITGPGSVVQIVSTSLGLPAGTPDNYNPFVGVGYDTPGSASGQLTISNGGKLILIGNAVSTQADSRVTSFQVGGRGLASGTGVATVTGAGSEISVSGYDSFIGVGRSVGSSGTLNVLDHALVSSTSLLVGERANGTLNVDNAQIILSGVRTDQPALGAGMTVGRGVGGDGVLNLSNGASLSINNDVFTGGMSIGGDTFVSQGTGAVSLTGGSSITFGGTLPGGGLNVGRTGVGTLTVAGASVVDVSNQGGIFVGREVGGIGTLTITGGSTVSGNGVLIGGSSDTVAGGIGAATVSGAGSLLRAAGADGFLSVGRSGTGSLTVSDQGSVSAIIMNVGRAPGGVGTMSVDDGVITLAGQQTTGTLNGAALSIGNRGGSGTVNITNNSVLTITNMGSSGASLNIGGTPINPLGTGTLTVSNSSVSVVAAPGQGIVRVGHDGTGTATFTASTLDVAGGSVIIAGQPGSIGTLTLNAGSVLNASYVGVGSTPSAVVGVQNPGGTGRLILNNSTLNTTTLEIGALGTLSGAGGVVNATGNVIVGGTISPGNSPARLVINCNLISLDGSKLILEILDTGSGFDIDHLVLGDEATFDLSHFQVVFSFLGNTDPTAFANSGGFDLDNFLQVGHFDGRPDEGLSTMFAPGETWESVLNTSNISFVSDTHDVSGLHYETGGTITAPVPEPGTWALMVVGLLALMATSQHRRRRQSAPQSRFSSGTPGA